MLRVRLAWCSSCLLVCFATIVTRGPLDAQEKGESSKSVEFFSADRVKLRGTLYPAGKGATVILLHAVGEDSSKKEWQSLAKRLQGAGHTVLAFDFRGHGQSTTVEPGMYNANPMLRIPGFWDEKENVNGIKGYNPKKRPTEIDQKQFYPGYLPILVNDIAAAVGYLAESGDANTHNLVLVGASDGATLGAIFINSEWHRYKVLPPQKGFPKGRPDLLNPEGANIRAAVWLSISDKLGAQTVSLATTLDVAARKNKVPMVFFYGDGDDKGKRIANACEKQLKTDKKNQDYLVAFKIKEADKLSGRNLLVDSLGTDRLIVSYLKNALDGRITQPKGTSGKEEKAPPYIWQWEASGRVIQRPARQLGASNTVFYNYAPFVR